MQEVRKLKNRILEVAVRDEMGHIPSALSILNIIWVLYDRIMKKDDQFILSKGHGVMALYAVLEEKGLLDWDTKLMGHPKRGGAIMASTGSLGHGLPMAVGLAMANKIKKEDGRIFCLIGDGECNEGTIWESSLLASHHKLNNLVVILDNNGSSTRALNMGSLVDKFHAFGFSVWDIYGHKNDEIELALNTKSDKPLMIIASTTKGYGVDMMRNNPEWHNRRLTQEDYEKIIS